MNVPVQRGTQAMVHYVMTLMNVVIICITVTKLLNVPIPKDLLYVAAMEDLLAQGSHAQILMSVSPAYITAMWMPIATIRLAHICVLACKGTMEMEQIAMI